jgi:hypothetical protein
MVHNLTFPEANFSGNEFPFLEQMCNAAYTAARLDGSIQRRDRSCAIPFGLMFTIYEGHATWLIYSRLLNGLNNKHFNRTFGRFQFQTKFLYRSEESGHRIGGFDRYRKRHAIEVHKAIMAEP